MTRFAGLFGALAASRRRTAPAAQPSQEASRADQRRQRMADAAVSLEDLRADAAALAGRPGEMAGPIHPGEILWEAFMKPIGIKAPTTAKALGVPRTRIERLLAGQTAMSPDTALRLSRAFPATTALFWLSLQAAYDLETAEPGLRKTLGGIRPFGLR